MRKNISVHNLWNIGAITLCIPVLIAYAFSYTMIPLKNEIILAVIPIIVLIYFLGKKRLLHPILSIQNHLLDHDDDVESEISKLSSTVEFRNISIGISALKTNITEASQFVKSIEEGTIDAEYVEQETDEENTHNPLKNALISMSAKMKEIALEDKERNWITEGLAKFMNLLRTENEDLKSLCNKIISNLVTYVESNQGGLFIINGDGEEESEKWLELAGCYAYNTQKYLNKRIEIGEGLLGQAFLEKQTTILSAVPDDYINITSGLGEAPPKNVLIVPLKTNEEIFGLIELASFQAFKDYQIDFIEKLGENIASTISRVQVNDQTKTLLRDMQEQTEQLRAQEEEMRQNHEEMQATQEAVARKQKELEISEQKSKAIFENSNDAILVSDISGKINGLNSAAKRLFKINDIEAEGHDHEWHVQEIIKKFDPEKSESFFKKRRRTKATTSEKNTINVEVYLTKEDLGGKMNFIIYVRDIAKEVEKDHQIAENLMYLDELKSELKQLKVEENGNE